LSRSHLASSILVAGVLAGCAGPIRHRLLDSAAIESQAGRTDALGWFAGATWKFTIKGKSGKQAETLVVRVTDLPGIACLGGNWKQLEIVTQSGHVAAAPMWAMERTELHVLLASQRCDDYPVLAGTFSEQGFKGDYYNLHLGGKSQLGRAVGIRVRH
jgi:hypothetical protein